MSIHRYAVVVFALSGVVAACSGGGSSPGPSSTPVPTASPTVKPTATASPAPTPSPTPNYGPVTVDVSGSTNTKPYQIVLQTDATAVVTRDYGTQDASMTSTTVAATDANQFFADLIADTPISNINPPSCTKTASFDTTTVLTYDSYTSGDLSCAPENGPPKGQTLYTDEQKIESDIRANIGTINN